MSIPCILSVPALAVAAAAAVELAIAIVVLDIVEEAVAMGIDMPLVDSVVDVR